MKAPYQHDQPANSRRRVMCRITTILLGFILPHALSGPVPAQSERYPSRPIRMIVPAMAAGPTDILARIASEHLSRAFAQPVVLDNVPGAGGNIGLHAAAKSAADGYTIFIASQGMLVLSPFLHPKLPYDAENDFAPVVLLAAPPYVLVTSAALPTNNLKELLSLLRSKPGQINFASTGGIASSSHIVGELFKKTAQVDLVHVPFKGNAQAATALIGGEVQLMFSLTAGVAPNIRSGRLKAIAIGSQRRSPALPDIPTFQEAGLPGFTATSWFAIMTRAGAPAPIVARLNEELNRMLRLPEVQARLLALGAEPGGGSTSELAAHLGSERAKWGPVIKEAGIKLN